MEKVRGSKAMDGLEGQNKGFVLDTGVQWQAEERCEEQQQNSV